MFKRYCLLLMWMVLAFYIINTQQHYLAVIDSITLQVNEDVPEISKLIDSSNSATFFSSYLLSFICTDDLSEVGTYQAYLKSPWNTYPFKIHVVDQKPPYLTLTKDVFLFEENKHIDVNQILSYLHIEDDSLIVSVTITPTIDTLSKGRHYFKIIVTDLYHNQSSIPFTIIINEVQTSFIPSPPTHSPVLNVCPNGQQKINPNKDCNEPAYDEYPDKLGSLSFLQEYGSTLHQSYFITNITLNDRSETYGLWITD